MHVLTKIFKNTISYIAITALLFSFVGSGFAESSNSIRVAKESERQNGRIKDQNKHQNGPPAHAPAHGHRAKFKYRYYPRSKVYYDVAREVYFYLKGENWEVGIALPSHLQKDLGEFVSLELDTDRPYLYIEEHNEKYSSKKRNLEKRQMNFFTKLWVLMFAR
jgi:hypothetical protein